MATESDIAGAAPQLRRPRPRVRLTLRLRLTLLYGACFLIAGAGVLGITYALFKHSQAGPTPLAFGQASFRVPATVKIGKTSAGTTITTTNASGTRVVTTVPRGKQPPKQLIAVIRASGQAQLNNVYRQAKANVQSVRAGASSSLLEYEGIALGGMAILSILLGWVLAGRALRPMREMNARARAITEESLHERLGLDGRKDELGELAGTFDQLLARLERAFDSQRRFVANASHELRTPLTLERTLMEVALSDPNASVESLREACERVISSTEQQERMIGALLALARSQADAGVREPVDLADLAGEVLSAREGRLSQVQLESDLAPAGISGDPALVERMITNLVDNAIVHNTESSPWIRVQTCTEDGVAVLRVSNAGPVIPADEVESLFEPFRRLEGERTSTDDRRLGLGLSIVRAVATAHSAVLRTEAQEQGGLLVEVRFPAVPLLDTA